METESDLYTPDDLIKKFKISEQTVYNWIEKGHLPKPIKMGRRIFWKKSEIDSCMEKNRKND